MRKLVLDECERSAYHLLVLVLVLVLVGLNFLSVKDTQSFNPPSKGYNSDWVLVLDDAAKAYPAPGTTAKAPTKAK